MNDEEGKGRSSKPEAITDLQLHYCSPFVSGVEVNGEGEREEALRSQK
jgi:hypothetical protein